LGYIIFILLLGVPMVEIGVFIEVGGLIGLWPTIAVIFITAAIGTGLLRTQGLAVMYRAQEAMSRGEMPLAQVFDGLCLLFAGALLLTPGFVTDAVGFLLFMPPLRALLGRGLAGFVAKRGGAHTWSQGANDFEAGPKSDGASVIDGDFKDVTGDQDSANKGAGGVERRIE
jgi:UPF0716 protein FxsA